MPTAKTRIVLSTILTLASFTGKAYAGSGKILSPESSIPHYNFKVEIELKPDAEKFYFLADLYAGHGWYAQLGTAILPFEGPQSLHLDLNAGTLDKDQIFTLILMEADASCKKMVEDQWRGHATNGGGPIKGFENGCKPLHGVSLKVEF